MYNRYSWMSQTANEIRERYVRKERRKDKETCYLKQ